ncbi:MAG TPA: Na(+)/H(+) antiporter subunit C [Acidimicrobiia bacterium]|nr:Na(+)/H(+) antiporter subunit C [Acidimicrobiia bacterium]
MNVLGPDLFLVIAAAVLIAGGIYLVLERSLTRIAVGLVLVGNGVNILFLITGGPRGGAPIVDLTPEEAMSDPLPQAMMLTAIVITLALTAFLVAMAHRSWQLHRHDEVQDDLEDRRVAARAATDRAAYRDIDTSSDVSLDEEAAEVHDETALEEAEAEPAAAATGAEPGAGPGPTSGGGAGA